MSNPDLAKQLKNISEKDRRQIEQAQEMLGPDPQTMGFIKNLYWGNFKEGEVFPYPETPAEETARCDQLLAKLDDYMRNEHPSNEIDQNQEIPEWAIKRLFEIGIMGMIIPQSFGGGGFSITSYNRALQRIGESCGSTAVMVSAHQSIGCGAINLFGTDEQKKRYLPKMAKDMLSAFCLSEPNVGCDAGGQETKCVLSDDGSHYILNGEKKWATSGALAGLFTVMAKQQVKDPKTGKVKERVTALICTPDMDGIDIFSRNRSKCGIRGTWQARIRFTDVKIPVANRLHGEGRGLHVALTCLNYGRCTLSAGMVGSAQAAYQQAIKWSQYRHQFDRPLADFDLVQDKLATMGAYCYALDAMLYLTTGIVDRDDEDIMLETAICKIFCSEYGFRTVDHALQIMGGDGYMTENLVERLWRDSRINTIVEGANEVMHSFVFAYGSKQLGEFMLGVKAAPLRNIGAAMQIGAELYLGLKRPAPQISLVHPRLSTFTRRLERMTQGFSHQVKLMFREHEEQLITNQMIQRRLSIASVWIHAMTCSLSKLDQTMRNGTNGQALDDEIAIVEQVFALGEEEYDTAIRALWKNRDKVMRQAAQVSLRHGESLPNSDYFLPEKTPDLTALGTGRTIDTENIPQFGSGSTVTKAKVPS